MDKDEISQIEREKVEELLESIELFGNNDSWDITDTYIEKNRKIFSNLMELGVVDLYYDCKYIGAGIQTHYFIKISVVVKEYIAW